MEEFLWSFVELILILKKFFVCLILFHLKRGLNFEERKLSWTRIFSMNSGHVDYDRTFRKNPRADYQIIY
jgi:hypothetical protein